MADDVFVPPTPPDGLSERACGLWDGFACDLDRLHGGADADFVALEALLRALDRLDGVRTALDAEGTTVEGSKGQLRPHPLLATEAELRREVVDGLRALGLLPAKGTRRDKWQTPVTDGRFTKRR